MNIRKLTGEDIPAFWALRLRGLREFPASFGADYAQASQISLEQVTERYAWAVSDDNFIVGAFAPTLVGAAALLRDDAAKKRHKAEVWGVYVAPEVQGQGVGRLLLDALITNARQLEGLEQLVLGVDAKNEVAIKLYRSVGFREFAYDPRTMKVGDDYVDEYLMALWLGDTPADFRPLLG